MGLFSSPRTKDQLVRELIAATDTECFRTEVIAHSLQRDALWTVVQYTAKNSGYMRLRPGESVNYIVCHPLQFCNGSWCSRSLDEAMCPYDYSCPFEFLDMAPELCPEWRHHVRLHHAYRLKSQDRSLIEA